MELKPFFSAFIAMMAISWPTVGQYCPAGRPCSSSYLRTSFLDGQEQTTASGTNPSDGVRVPVAVKGTRREIRIVEAFVETAGGSPRYTFKILNSAPVGVSAYEVRWSLFNSQGEEVNFASTGETASQFALIEPGQEYTPAGGGSCMMFKSFQMERATVELTYYELQDGTIYDSHTTKFGYTRTAHRAQWAAFYRHIEEKIDGKSGPDAESALRSAIAEESARKPRTDAALAAESLQVRLDRQGFEPTVTLLRQAIASAGK